MLLTCLTFPLSNVMQHVLRHYSSTNSCGFGYKWPFKGGKDHSWFLYYSHFKEAPKSPNNNEEIIFPL